MKKLFLSLLSVVFVLMTYSCVNNPLLEEWDTPYGIPPFEKVMPEHYMPAFLAAMEAHNVEINAIISNKEEPNFENTILALDNSGELFSKVSAVFGSESGVRSSEKIMSIAKELSPIRSRHFNEINLNDALFQKVKAVYEKRNNLNLDKDQIKLVEETYKEFERSGANLPIEKKNELKVINEKISDLQLTFGQNLLKETAAFVLEIDNEKDLAGLSQAQISEAASRAKAAGKEGKWLFGLDNPSVMPFLQYSDNRELRTKMMNGYLNRCNNDNNEDNKVVISDLIKYRLEKAKIMGYDSYANYVLVDRMAKTPEAVYELLDQIWAPALKVANQELSDIQEMAKKEGITDAMTPADWRYYFEKSLKSKYEISDDQLRPYFQLENVREGIFYVANKLYGITFTQLSNIPLPHPEAIAFECKESDGTLLGVLFMDMFARPGEKRGGAWCGGYREQTYKNGQRVAPLVNIVGNFTRPVEGKPALLSADEVETYFHEFGHALQSLLQNVKYLGLTGITRDFVELPSQIMEHWAFKPEVLKVYAKHFETGEIIPIELVTKLENSGKYGQGFATTEYLAASYLDMDFHVLQSIKEDLDIIQFEQLVLGERNLLTQIPPRYRSTYFNHTFGGGYTAGYYSYIWAEVLDCDAFQAFVETGDIFNKDIATKFRKEILERAGEEDAMNLYLNFRGQKPGIEPLLKNRGLN